MMSPPVAAVRTLETRMITASTPMSTSGIHVVVLAWHGETEVRTGAATIRLGAGEMAVVPPDSALTVAPGVAARALCAELPAFVLEPWCAPDTEPWVARGDRARIAADLLVALHTERPAERDDPGILGALARLLAAGAESTADVSSDEVLRSRILRHVDTAIRVGPVTPADTAERFGISVRKLHQLFAGQPRSFMQTVMDRRALWCAVDVRATPDASPSALARRWGFADSSHFQRVWARLDSRA
ncbi:MULTISPECIES: hypothetical protein [Microbacterium]|uniref:hypothetical protein n=1 Tax=Microbacterium TaxID=33882 RepID=UPI001D1775EB|nr:hypothetical protein [Microbacterium testaceum]MCC4250566.1 hypothetical protein [Microbacterium testaceum]